MLQVSYWIFIIILYLILFNIIILDSAVHGEAVKRKIDDTVVDSKLAENVAVEVTPEKKAKIEDNAKEELKTSTTETSEVAA